MSVWLEDTEKKHMLANVRQPPVAGPSASLQICQLIDLRCHDEIVFVQALDLMSLQ
jgi:hypothetical protein